MGEAINFVNNFKVDNVVFNCGEYNNLEKNLIMRMIILVLFILIMSVISFCLWGMLGLKEKRIY